VFVSGKDRFVGVLFACLRGRGILVERGGEVLVLLSAMEACGKQTNPCFLAQSKLTEQAHRANHVPRPTRKMQGWVKYSSN